MSTEFLQGKRKAEDGREEGQEGQGGGQEGDKGESRDSVEGGSKKRLQVLEEELGESKVPKEELIEVRRIRSTKCQTLNPILQVKVEDQDPEKGMGEEGEERAARKWKEAREEEAWPREEGERRGWKQEKDPWIPPSNPIQAIQAMQTMQTMQTVYPRPSVIRSSR